MKALLLLLAAQSAPDEPASVGVNRRLDGVVLPGPQLEVRPLKDAQAPVALRIAQVYPHGTAYRYDFIYFGWTPGTFDLRELLQRKDGSSMDGVPAIPVEIRPAYPGPMKNVSDIRLGTGPSLGGFRAALVSTAAVWVAALVFLVLARRKKAAAAAPPPMTLADRLRPLVTKARSGAISQEEQAELERLLLGFWRKREGLEGVEVAQAIAELRRRETSGALLRALEGWLHRPGGAADFDPRLLEPYERNIL